MKNVFRFLLLVVAIAGYAQGQTLSRPVSSSPRVTPTPTPSQDTTVGIDLLGDTMAAANASRFATAISVDGDQYFDSILRATAKNNLESTLTVAQLNALGSTVSARMRNAFCTDCLNLTGASVTPVYWDGYAWKQTQTGLAVVPSSGLTDAQRIAFADSIVDSSVPSGDYLNGKVVVTRSPTGSWPYINGANATAWQDYGFSVTTLTPGDNVIGAFNSAIGARAQNTGGKSFYFCGTFRVINIGNNEAVGLGVIDTLGSAPSYTPIVEFCVDKGNLFSTGATANVGIVAGVLSGSKTVQVSSVPFAAGARIDGRCYVSSALVRGKINGAWLADITTNIPSIATHGAVVGRVHRNTAIASTFSTLLVHSAVCISFTSF